jgi:hypothetical protein
MEQAAETTQSSAEAISASLNQVTTSAREIPIVYGQMASSAQSAAASVQTLDAALPSLTAAEQQNLLVAHELFLAREANAEQMMGQMVQAASVEAEAWEENARRTKAAIEEQTTAVTSGGINIENMMVRMVARMAIMVTVIAAIRGVISAIGDAISEEKDFYDAVETSTEVLARQGDAADNNETRISNYGRAVQEAGIKEADFATILRDVVPVAGNTDNALNAVQLGLDLVATKALTAKEAGALLRGLLEGDEKSVNKALKNLGINASDAQDALEKLHATFGGGQAGAELEISTLDRIKEGFVGFWKQAADISGLDTLWMTQSEKLKKHVTDLQKEVERLNKLADAEKEHPTYGGDIIANNQLPTAIAQLHEAEEALRKFEEAKKAAEEKGREAEETPIATNDSQMDQYNAALDRMDAERKAAAEKRARELEQENANLAKSELDVAHATEQAAAAQLKKAQDMSSVDDASKKALAALEEEKTKALAVAKAEEDRALAEAEKNGGDIAKVRETYENKVLVITQEYANRRTAIQEEAARKELSIQGEAAKGNEAIAKSELDIAKATEKEASEQYRIAAGASAIEEGHIKAQAEITKSISDIHDAAQAVETALTEEQTKAIAVLHAEAQQAIIEAKKSGESVDAVKKEYANKELALKKETAAKIDAIEKDSANKIKKIDDDVEKHKEELNRRELAAAHRTTSDLLGMMSEYGGKTGQTLAQIGGFAEQMYQLWRDASELFHAFEEARNTTAAIQAIATTKTTAAAQISASAGAGAAAAGASVAQDGPYGWMMVPAVAAETFSELMSFQASVVAAQGYEVPSYASPVAQLHPREVVLPANISEGLKRMISMGAGGAQNNYINIQSTDAKSVKQLFLEHKGALASALRSHARDFGRVQ